MKRNQQQYRAIDNSDLPDINVQKQPQGFGVQQLAHTLQQLASVDIELSPASKKVVRTIGARIYDTIIVQHQSPRKALQRISGEYTDDELLALAIVAKTARSTLHILIEQLDDEHRQKWEVLNGKG